MPAQDFTVLCFLNNGLSSLTSGLFLAFSRGSESQKSGVWGMKHCVVWRCFAAGSQCLHAQSPHLCLRQIPASRSPNSLTILLHRPPCATVRAQKRLCTCSSPLSPPEGSMPPQVEQHCQLKKKITLAFQGQKKSLQRVSPWTLRDIPHQRVNKGSRPGHKDDKPRTWETTVKSASYRFSFE